MLLADAVGGAQVEVGRIVLMKILICLRMLELKFGENYV